LARSNDDDQIQPKTDAKSRARLARALLN